VLKKRLLLGFLICAFFFSGGLYLHENYVWSHKYNRSPPNVIFAEVIGVPVPSGVTNLQVAGRQFVIKRWVRMSFNATPSALKILTKGREPIDSWLRSHALAGGKGLANDRFESMDLQTVGLGKTWRE
jgi:hypothetical protein